MERSDFYAGLDPHIEVHKYYPGVVAAAVILALVLQAFFPEARYPWRYEFV